VTSIELMDDLEAGELSVEFEGLEPWDVLEWALGRFGERLSLSTAFQDGDVDELPRFVAAVILDDEQPWLRDFQHEAERRKAASCSPN